MEKQQLLTAPKLAEILNMPEDGVWRLARKGTIPAIRIGRNYRFDLTDVMQALKGEAK